MTEGIKPILIKIENLHGYHLNENTARVNSVLDAIRNRTNGNCPCVPKYTYSKDTICPCLYYRTGQGCHCDLYVK